MKKITIILAIIVLIFMVAIACGIYYISENNDVKPVVSVSSNVTKTLPIKVNYSNFAEIISKNEVVRDLPEGAILQLQFYNYNSGERQDEKSFVIKRASVREGSGENADIVLSLSSKYLNELTSRNFCDVIKKANANRDLGFDSKISSVALAWKFKSVMKYKDCFGM
jgi:hypothetical protein